MNKKSRKNGEFIPALARIAVAQICETLGLQGFQQSALDALSDIACKYIQDIGNLSTFYANVAGRTQINAFDIVHGLQDLGLSQGFAGGSDLDYCLSESGVVNEISRYIIESEEVGFAYCVPPFPVVKERESVQSFFHCSETPPLDNIPPWLPCFPDPETYTETKRDKVDQDQKVDVSLLLTSDQRLVCSGLKVPFVIKRRHNNEKGEVNNPFVAAALEYGEMKVSFVSLPARLVEEDAALNRSLWAKHVSSLWTFAPVIQGLKSCDLEIYEGSKEIAVENRPSVQLKFNTRKKSSAIASKHRKIENAEFMSWFDFDDSGNDRNMIEEKNEEDSFKNGNTDILK